ncbi:N-acetylmuramoyl-L-alanine amidase [Lysinibacillus sp. SGAir0095]|uniref:N-acetylmuramoyl-L-alanine amidase n=1 Tax=Lysinibacillus sp. SGAir0095 TaxID=2070463 RepID=UPI0010CD3133|nr:N-acetylmuramoyl-L-alanine amidase [Lysinibacillus sp. SGAir0095]QCR31467.1 N-acetylmuramoyl-L-alanine amidase [Lysinibacillus sp. SGAir0095]
MSAKKIVSILVALCLLVPVVGARNTSAAAIFADVPSSHALYEEINYIKSLNIAGGYNEGGKLLYKPDLLTTRSQVTIMLVNARGIAKVKKAKSSYSDVPSGSGLSEFVEGVTAKGLLVEKSTDGKFYPSLAVTFKEASLLIAKAYNLEFEKYSTYPVPFSGIKASDPYYKYISALYYSGILEGDIGEVKPNQYISRGLFSLLLARANSPTFRLELPIQGVAGPEDDDVIGKVEVTVDNLNVRSTPSTSSTSNRVGQVDKGTQFNVYEDSNGWLKVAYKGVYAYISKEYAKYISGETTTPETPTPEEPTPPTPGEDVKADTIGRVTVNNLNVRSGPGASYSSIGKLNTGDEVVVQSISNYWAKISYGNKVGYTHKSYLKLINQTSGALKNRIIVLDPGHGGKDPGAISESATEKAIVLKVGTLVKQKLEAAGAKVVMTRTGDTYPTLQDRVKITNDNYGEIFVSIHVNSAASSSAKGTETYYSVSSGDMYKEDINLATKINNQIVTNANMQNRGVKEQSYYVIHNMIIPSVLVELGFISNSDDKSKLVNDKYVSIFADSIYKGIVQYYSN